MFPINCRSNLLTLKENVLVAFIKPFNNGITACRDWEREFQANNWYWKSISKMRMHRDFLIGALHFIAYNTSQSPTTAIPAPERFGPIAIFVTEALSLCWEIEIYSYLHWNNRLYGTLIKRGLVDCHLAYMDVYMNRACATSWTKRLLLISDRRKLSRNDRYGYHFLKSEKVVLKYLHNKWQSLCYGYIIAITIRENLIIREHCHVLQ